MRKNKPLSWPVLSFLFDQLRRMSRAGIPLSQSLQVLCHDIPHEGQRRRLRHAVRCMEQGQAFSHTMEQAALFSPLACQVVRAGEQSGQLEEMFGLLSVYYHEAHTQRQALYQTLAYPVFLLCCTGCLLMGAVLGILPAFSDMFREMGVPLPETTARLLSGAQFIREYIRELAAGAGCCVIIVSCCLRHEPWRQEIMRRVCTSPMFGQLCLVCCWQRFSQILAIQLRSGVPVLEGLHDAAQAVPLAWFRHEIRQVCRFVGQGVSVSQAMKRCGLTTPYIMTMLIVGEATGSYDEALQSISDYYAAQMRRWLTQCQKALGPALLLIAGSVVGLLIICLLLPLLEMASGAGI